MAEKEVDPLAVKDYRIVRIRLDETNAESSFLALESEVKFYLNEGYVIAGSIVLYQPVQYNDRWIFQVVVKE